MEGVKNIRENILLEIRDFECAFFSFGFQGGKRTEKRLSKIEVEIEIIK